MEAAVEPPNGTRKKWLHGVSAFFLSVATALVVWWWGWGEYREWTEDAYVHGNMIGLTPQVKGTASRIYCDETQHVEEGQLLVELDPTDFDLALASAKADLAESVRQVTSYFERARRLEAELEVAEAGLMKAWTDYIDRRPLVESGAVAKEEFIHSETALMAADGRLRAAVHGFYEALSQVEGTTVQSHPMVVKASEAVRRAFVDRARCEVRSPVSGIVTMRSVQVGQEVSPAAPMLAVVPLEQIWVDANFKEVQLKNLRIGQPVRLRADMYGRSVLFEGRLVGINPGTGAVFSLLPPQNATGNWIKIVQRVPVRIALDPEQVRRFPLWLGLSMDVTVVTRDRQGERVALELPQPEKPLYSTKVLAEQINGAEECVEQVMKENLTIDESASFREIDGE